MQKIPGKVVPVPPVYKPGAARAVLQAKPAIATATQPKVKVPPAFSPTRQPLLQTKPVSMALPHGQLIQRAERKTNNKKQEKIKAAQAHKKVEKERLKQKTLTNAAVYGGFTNTTMVSEFIDSGGVVKGHHSEDSNFKASGHTTSGLQKLREFNANYQSEESSGEENEVEFRAPKEKVVAPTTAQTLEAGAIKAWDNAVDLNKSGLVAMREYLANRRRYNPGVTDEMVEKILEDWSDYPVNEKLPEV